jgi:hypothetical protein
MRFIALILAMVAAGIWIGVDSYRLLYLIPAAELGAMAAAALGLLLALPRSTRGLGLRMLALSAIFCCAIVAAMRIAERGR